MNINQEREKLTKELQRHANPERAVGEKKYLKSSMNHYGVSMPTIHKIAKNWVQDNLNMSIDEVIQLAESLWSSDYHEDRMLVDSILELRKSELTLKHMPIIEKFINTAAGWAQLDGIVVHLVGALIDHDKQSLSYLKKWIKSENFWVRRAAILSQNMHFRRGEGDIELFERLVVPQFIEGDKWSKDERFFIRKAIGWALRELAPRQPRLVFDFVKKYESKMSGLTYREATRKLPPELKQQL